MWKNMICSLRIGTVWVRRFGMLHHHHGFGVRELVGAALELSCVPSVWFSLHDTRSATRRLGGLRFCIVAVGPVMWHKGSRSSVIIALSGEDEAYPCPRYGTKVAVGQARTSTKQYQTLFLGRVAIRLLIRIQISFLLKFHEDFVSSSLRGEGQS
jgi:hypothetical protein